MLDIQQNYPLKDLTTMRIGGPARYFATCHDQDELQEALAFARDKGLEVFLLGGGSNIIVSDKGFDGMVIQFQNVDKKILSEDDTSVLLRVAGGEVLDDVVAWAVDNNWCGMENMSFVPGRAAGLAVQNVHAYGHEASNIIETVDVIDSTTGEAQTLANKDCDFAYRSSRFNTTDKGRFVIVALTLKLSKKRDLILTYPDVKKWFDGRDQSTIMLKEIREAITTIRKRKGLDWNTIQSAGSTFKNLLLTEEQFETLRNNVAKNYGDDKAQGLDELRARFAKVEQLYTSQTGVQEKNRGKMIKIPTAYLFDKIMNLKGTKHGGAQLSQEQAISIINMGDATSDDVMQLFKKIRQLVYVKTGMEVTNEPELIGFTQEELKDYFALE